MASKLSDRELRRQALMLDDPYLQPDLETQYDPGVPILDILNLYVSRDYPKKKVLCAFCGSHRHRDGFTGMRLDGKRQLFGTTCGQKVLGESWAQANKRMKALRDRQYELDRLDRMGPIFHPLKLALRSWVRPLTVLSNRLIGFRSGLGEMASRVQEAALRQDGMLRVHRKTRHKMMESGPTYIEVNFGRVPGASLFTVPAGTDLAAAVAAVISAVEAVEKAVANTDILSTSLLTRRRKHMERCFSNLEEVHQAYCSGQAFFTEETFRFLANWSRARQGSAEEYVFRDNRLEYSDGRRGNELPPRPLPDLALEPLELIREYRRAD